MYTISYRCGCTSECHIIETTFVDKIKKKQKKYNCVNICTFIFSKCLHLFLKKCTNYISLKEVLTLVTQDFIRTHLTTSAGIRTLNLQRSGQRLLTAPPCNVGQTDNFLQIGHEASCVFVGKLSSCDKRRKGCEQSGDKILMKIVFDLLFPSFPQTR